MDNPMKSSLALASIVALAGNTHGQSYPRQERHQPTPAETRAKVEKARKRAEIKKRRKQKRQG